MERSIAWTMRRAVASHQGTPFRPSRLVERRQRRLDLRLVLLPDDVDLRVVCDGFQRDVRDAFVDEAVPDIAVCRLLDEGAAADLRLFTKAFRRVGEQVVQIPRAQNTRTGKH